MTIEEMFHDYNSICKMKSPLKIKSGMLTQLFRMDEHRWRVVGITANALKVFHNHKYKREVRIGINRSHVYERNKIYAQMLSAKFENSKDWWDFYHKHDETILATSSENNTGNFSKIYRINYDKLQLFKSRGFSWRHNKPERDFLEKLYNKYFL
ncbi:hypothetical protein LK994_04725 [Ferruginibacter lapsinanis]|uniref:hypothetical protein n=1 Tax=Ferruginibacter lapsinanis TaxID=563172 RepID=UPI001E576D60|nr:hypothetical protein [Ferruginibacter lapsinanis]UEG50777.1 hypothetical protein LK994_04725 [Ferruginibacter lapsinanis]